MAKRQLERPTRVHHIPDELGPVRRFNAKLGLRVSVIVGTMWCAYLFTVLALISLPSALRSIRS